MPIVRLVTVMDGPGPVRVTVLGAVCILTRCPWEPFPANRATWKSFPTGTAPPVAVRTFSGEIVTVPAATPVITRPKLRSSYCTNDSDVTTAACASPLVVSAWAWPTANARTALMIPICNRNFDFGPLVMMSRYTWFYEIILTSMRTLRHPAIDNRR